MQFFQNSIFTQESFLWANDLSAPDFIINLPFGIPFTGDQIGGVCTIDVVSWGYKADLRGVSGGGAAAKGGSADENNAVSTPNYDAVHI